MQVRDVMQADVVTVEPDSDVRYIAKRLLENRISAVPVVDETRHVVGIVSEGDLMRRPESHTERHLSWWLRLAASPDDRAIEYVKSHGRHARDVMVRDVITIQEEASLEKAAELLEKHYVKRLPVLKDGKLVGIVSRADLLHGLVARQAAPVASGSDRQIRAAVERTLSDAGVRTQLVSVVVSGGMVHLWGAAESEARKRAAGVAAENVPGVKGVRNDIGVLPPSVMAVMWAE